MNLTANIEGHGVSLRLADAGYADAAVVNELAGLEVQIEGDVRVFERDDKRPNVLSLSMTPERMRQLVTLLADKTGMPAFTEGEWRSIASVLRTSRARVSHELADRIDAAYQS